MLTGSFGCSTRRASACGETRTASRFKVFSYVDKTALSTFKVRSLVTVDAEPISMFDVCARHPVLVWLASR